MSISYYYRPPAKLREGNVFTSVCHSVHGGYAWSQVTSGGGWVGVGIPEGDGVGKSEGVGRGYARYTP